MATARKLIDLQVALAFQWLPRRVIERAQLGWLRRMVAFCENEVPLYRESFRKAGVRAADLRSLEDLGQFPTLTREQVVAAYPDGIRWRAPEPGDIVFRTSGTSGLLMKVAYSARANDWLDAVYGRALMQTGYRPWHRLAYFWPDPRPQRAYERLGLMRKHYLPMDPDPRTHLEMLRRIRPRYIYNFPSVMMMLARLVKSEGLGNLRPEGIICHGELMPDPIRDAIADAFGCPVWNQYGAQEFNRIGWDCHLHRAMHLDADSVLLEVLDLERVCPPGEEGEIVVTGLRNPLMPLIRYRIGDAGRRVAGDCPCGRGLPLFELTEGRMDDFVLLPDGRRIGARVFAPAIEAFDGFSQYRLIQTRRDHLDLLVVCQPTANAQVPDRVAEVVRQIVGPAVSVRVRAVEGIPLSRRGKLRKVVCEVADRGESQPVAGTGAPA